MIIPARSTVTGTERDASIALDLAAEARCSLRPWPGSPRPPR